MSSYKLTDQWKWKWNVFVPPRIVFIMYCILNNNVTYLRQPLDSSIRVQRQWFYVLYVSFLDVDLRSIYKSVAYKLLLVFIYTYTSVYLYKYKCIFVYYSWIHINGATKIDLWLQDSKFLLVDCILRLPKVRWKTNLLNV